MTPQQHTIMQNTTDACVEPEEQQIRVVNLTQFILDGLDSLIMECHAAESEGQSQTHFRCQAFLNVSSRRRMKELDWAGRQARVINMAKGYGQLASKCLPRTNADQTYNRLREL